MALYIVCGNVTISVSTLVEASSEEEAKVIAWRRDPGHIHDNGNCREEWITSGEIDGTPEIVSVSKV